MGHSYGGGMQMRKTILSIMAGLAVCLQSVVATGEGNPEAGKAKSAACAACHMPDGNSVNPEWPKIAGQLPNYLASQLRAFKSGERVNEIMDPFLAPLSEQDIEDVAAYFSTQKISVSPNSPGAMAVGEKLYNKGVFYTPLTACTGCHGMNGEGNRSWREMYVTQPTVLAPAIGGQHAAYLGNQLRAFRSGERSNDVGSVMQKIAQQMSDEQIEAVAQYVAQLQ